MIQSITIPNGINTCVLKADPDDNETTIDYIDFEELVSLGCVEKRANNAYTWHKCAIHDFIIIWESWD